MSDAHLLFYFSNGHAAVASMLLVWIREALFQVAAVAFGLGALLLVGI